MWKLYTKLTRIFKLYLWMAQIWLCFFLFSTCLLWRFMLMKSIPHKMNPRSRRQLILLITVKLEKKCKERKYSKNNVCGEMILSQIVLISLVKNYLCFKSKELKQTYSVKTRAENWQPENWRYIFSGYQSWLFRKLNLLNFHYFPFSYSVLFHVFCYLSGPEVIWVCNPSFKKLFLHDFKNISKCAEQILLFTISRHVNSLQCFLRLLGNIY